MTEGALGPRTRPPLAPDESYPFEDQWAAIDGDGLDGLIIFG